MPRKSLDDLGELQSAVMEAVWALGEATVQQVRDRVGRRKSLAYPTVLSSMQKLERAGWLRHRARGRTYVYRPACSREHEGARSLRKLTRRVFRGDPLLLFQHFIEDRDFSEEDLSELRAMIDRRRKELRDG